MSYELKKAPPQPSPWGGSKNTPSLGGGWGEAASSPRSPFIARSAFILLIALAISACSEEAMNTDTDAGKMEGIPLSDVPIAFTDPGQEKGDGLLPLSTGDRTTDNLTAMTVYAHYTGADDFDNVTASTPNFMFAQSVTKGGSGWTYSPLKYWPAQHEKVSFFAIAPGPTEENGIELITSNGTYTGYPSFTVTPPASPTLQEDFCVASALNRTDDTDGGKVPLHFDHTMAKVTFAAKYVSDETLDVFMRQIKLTDIYSSSILHLTATGFTWDTPATKGDYSLFAADNTLVGTSLIKDGDVGDATVSTEAGTLMLLPQTIPAGATLEVTTRWVGKVTEIRKINMPELTMGAGKSYNYNLTIDENSLSSFQWDWEYTGVAQTFIAPIDGTYTLEAWGAGEYKGGYSTGTIVLKAGQCLYAYVGNYDGGRGISWNGGGSGANSGQGWGGNSGGGATDFRLVSGNWDAAASLNSRIMVAGGSGATGYHENKGSTKGGYGGGLTAGNGAMYECGGGSQIAGGKKGNGRAGGGPGSWGYGRDASGRAAGGGGGYYGGGTTQEAQNGAATGSGGGSSFISGFTGCVAINPTDVTNDPRTQDATGNPTALSYSTSLFGESLTWIDGGKIVFSNARMFDSEGYEWIDGQRSSITGGMITCPAGTTGYARITLLTN